MNAGSGSMEAISKECVREFCTENNIRLEELAQVAGYSNRTNFSRALRNGYVKAEAVYNICKFFDLPRNYFEGAHGGTGDVAKVETKPITAYAPTAFPHPLGSGITGWRVADELMDFYGEESYTSLFIRLVNADTERHKSEILAKRLERLSKEELIAELVKQMSA